MGQQRTLTIVTTIMLAALSIGCGVGSRVTPTSQPKAVSPSATENNIISSTPSSDIKLTEGVEAQPTVDVTPIEMIEAQPTSYNLPITLLTDASGLYASPNREDLITPGEIPAGEKIYAMGRNRNGSHLRVVWNTSVGWLPTSFTDFNGRQDQLGRLPVFEREPPQCAEPITSQASASATWKSDRKQRIAVVIDIFRDTYGDFPQSYLALTVNGNVVESSRREIVERGQFSLKDVVFSLPARIQDGDVLGYDLETSSQEPLTFVSTIFGVPNNCQWDT